MIAAARAERRLLPFLLASALLHGVLLALHPLRGTKAPPVAVLHQALQATLQHSASSAEVLSPSRSPAARDAVVGPPRPSASRSGSAAVRSPGGYVVVPAVGSEATPPVGERESAAANELMEQARRAARVEAIRMEREVLRAPAPAGEGSDAYHASPGSRERRFADGTVRVNTRWGTSYCLKPPPEFARGGPGDGVTAPTNCPW